MQTKRFKNCSKRLIWLARRNHETNMHKNAWQSFEKILQFRSSTGAFLILLYRLIYHVYDRW